MSKADDISKVFKLFYELNNWSKDDPDGKIIAVQQFLDDIFTVQRAELKDKVIEAIKKEKDFYIKEKENGVLNYTFSIVIYRLDELLKSITAIFKESTNANR